MKHSFSQSIAGGTLRKLGRWMLDHRYLVIVQAFLLLPALYILWERGARGAFSYLSGDVPYYLVVARNIVELGMVSFDQAYPTNGFHPLWQASLAALYAPFALIGISAEAFTVVVFLASLALVALSFVVLYRVLGAAYGGVGPLFLLFPAGVYGLAALVNQPSVGTLQSFANGMESPALLLVYCVFLGCFAMHLRWPTMRTGLLAGAMLGIVALARLDHGLIAVFALPAMVLIRFDDTRFLTRLQYAVAAGAAAAAILGAYLLWSRLYVGTWLPVSGVVKAPFPSVPYSFNLTDATRALRDLVFGEEDPHRPMFLWRTMQLLVPAAVAAVYCAIVAVMAIFRRSAVTPISVGLAATGLGVIALSAYNFVFVPMIEQGEWYMPVGVLLVTLCVYDLAQRVVPMRLRHARPARAAAAVALIAFNYHLAPTVIAGRNEIIHRDMFHYAAPLDAHYAGQDVRLLSFHDGIFAYGTRLPTMSGLLFTADPEAVRLYREDGLSLPEIAAARGYHHAPVLMPMGHAVTPGLQDEDLMQAMRGMGSLFGRRFQRPWELPPLRFEVDYIGEDGRVVVVKFTAPDAAGETTPED